MRVFVANIGVISALGKGVSANLQNLLNGQHGLSAKSVLLDPVLTDFPIGQVPYTNEQLQDELKVPASIPRTGLLSLMAAREALSQFPCNGLRLGFFSGTTVGGMDKSERFFKDYIPAVPNPQIRDIIYHTCGSVTNAAAKYLGKFDYISTINTACSSSANAIITAARKIRQGQLDAAIAGGSDALCRFTLNGFNSLLILDDDLCRPFDQSRKGLNLGEGAGYVLLISERIAARYNAMCELVGYANTNDAYHATASSENGEGSYLAMHNAIQMAGITPAQIDYINLHGTGTQNNDQSEGNALKRVFGNNIPSFSSTKSYTGHTLAASGGIEAVYSCLAISKQVVFPNLRFKTPMDDSKLFPLQQIENKRVDYVLSNSFGFGGNCSSLLFKRL